MNKIYILIVALSMLSACNKVTHKESDTTMIASCCSVYVEPKPVLTIEDLSAETRLTYNKSSKWIQPKKTDNTIYCYFQIQNEKARNLRFRIEYIGEKYKNADKYVFIADSLSFEYLANKNRSSNIDPRELFFWYDESVYQSDLKLFEALAEAKEARIELTDRGNGTTTSLPLSAETRQDIKLIYDYYQSLGGTEIPRKGMVNIRQQ